MLDICSGRRRCDEAREEVVDVVDVFAQDDSGCAEQISHNEYSFWLTMIDASIQGSVCRHSLFMSTGLTPY